MREDTDKRERDRLGQTVSSGEKKKGKNSHTHACARPDTQTHTHNLDREISDDCMQTRHCIFPPQGGAVQSV